jgi:hypothetical protein
MDVRLRSGEVVHWMHFSWEGEPHMSDARSSSAGGSTAGILALLGGALMALGSFLSWARVDAAGASVSARGTDGTDGYITLVCGIVLVLYGIGRMTGAAAAGKRALAVIAIVAGLIGGGVALYDASSAKRKIVDDAAAAIANRAGISTTQARALLNAAISSGQVKISLALGIFVVIAGGVLGLVGGISGLSSTAGAPPNATVPSTTMPPAAPPMASTPMPPAAPPMTPPPPPSYPPAQPGEPPG